MMRRWDYDDMGQADDDNGGRIIGLSSLYILE